MADHSKPTITSTYTNFVSEIDGRLDDLALGLDPATTSPTNVPTNAIRWNSASKKWQQWSGTAWGDLSSEYAINLSAGAVISGSTSSDALRITQTGTGNALVVEDSTNPDSTPFVINSVGIVINGSTSSKSTRISSASISPAIQQVGGTNDLSNIGVFGFATNPGLLIAKANGTEGSPSAVVDGNYIARISGAGFDGTNYTEAGSIRLEVDGTPGTDDMPGRLVFSTTAAGDSSPTERMHITSAGNVEIGSAIGLSVAPLQVGVNEPGAEALRLAWNGGSTTQGYASIGFSTAQASAQPNAEIRGEEIDTSDYRGNLVFFTRGTTVSTDAPTERMRIDYNGTVTLASTSGLSIGRTAVTSPASTDGNVFSGTYTPTLTNTTNISASSAGIAQYMRVGNVVTVSGQVDIDPTAAGDTIMGVSLPVASNLTAQTTCAGTFAVLSGTVVQGGSIYGDSTNDRATFRMAASDLSNRAYQYHFTYRVI